MTRQVTRLAGALAGATSRRGFLGRLARMAGGVAAGAAVVLAAASAHAKPGGPNTGKPTTYCCFYSYGYGEDSFVVCKKGKGTENPCPPFIEPKRGDRVAWLGGSWEVSHCRECTDPYDSP